MAFVLMVYQKPYFFNLAFPVSRKILVEQNDGSMYMQQAAAFNLTLPWLGLLSGDA